MPGPIEISEAMKRTINSQLTCRSLRLYFLWSESIRAEEVAGFGILCCELKPPSMKLHQVSPHLRVRMSLDFP